MALVPTLASSIPGLRGFETRAAVMGIALILRSFSPRVSAQARGEAPGLFVQGGQSLQQDRATRTMFFGVMLPKPEPEPGVSVTRYWELFGGQWRGLQANGASGSFSQLGAALIWRKRFDDNRSAWFAEGGLGVSYLDGDYAIPDGRIFGSRLTFNGRLGLGRSFGARAGHELSLNYQHFSNGGIRKPNPGMDLVQLRYAHRF